MTVYCAKIVIFHCSVFKDLGSFSVVPCLRIWGHFPPFHCSTILAFRVALIHWLWTTFTNGEHDYYSHYKHVHLPSWPLFKWKLLWITYMDVVFYWRSGWIKKPGLWQKTSCISMNTNRRCSFISKRKASDLWFSSHLFAI